MAIFEVPWFTLFARPPFYVPRILQTAGRRLTPQTVAALNRYFGRNIPREVWRRAIEKLKQDGLYRNNEHYRIREDGDIIGPDGKSIGNLGQYVGGVGGGGFDSNDDWSGCLSTGQCT